MQSLEIKYIIQRYKQVKILQYLSLLDFKVTVCFSHNKNADIKFSAHDAFLE